MARYLCIEDDKGNVTAYEDSTSVQVKSAELTSRDDTAGWLWMQAESEEDAENRYHERHDKWREDLDRGNEEQATY